MKNLLLFATLFLSNLSFSQNFVYTFKGTLSEEKKTKLIESINQLNFFQEIKYKEKELSGQLFFTIPKGTSEGGKNDNYTTSTIKAYLIEAGLEPIDIYQR